MSSTSTTSSPPPSFQATTVEEFCRHLAAKQPTPGGGAAAAVSAALGAAAAHMAAVYTQQRPVENDAAAAAAQRLMQVSDIDALLQMANDDAAAYTALQATWKKNCPVLTADEKSQVQAGALAVPTNLVHGCHQRIRAIYDDFLPHCNPHIQSDAYVGIHLLAGAARAAYQTVLVNTPSAAHKANLARLLVDIQNVEAQVLVFVGK